MDDLERSGTEWNGRGTQSAKITITEIQEAYAKRHAVERYNPQLRTRTPAHAPAHTHAENIGAQWDGTRATACHSTNSHDLPGPVTITLTPLPAKPGEPPSALRLKQLLKLALRGFNFRAEWADPTASLSESQSEPTANCPKKSPDLLPVGEGESVDLPAPKVARAKLNQVMQFQPPFNCFDTDHAPARPETPAAIPATRGVPQARRRTLTTIQQGETHR